MPFGFWLLLVEGCACMSLALLTRDAGERALMWAASFCVVLVALAVYVTL